MSLARIRLVNQDERGWYFQYKELYQSFHLLNPFEYALKTPFWLWKISSANLKDAATATVSSTARQRNLSATAASLLRGTNAKHHLWRGSYPNHMQKLPVECYDQDSNENWHLDLAYCRWNLFGRVRSWLTPQLQQLFNLLLFSSGWCGCCLIPFCVDGE